MKAELVDLVCHGRKSLRLSPGLTERLAIVVLGLALALTFAACGTAPDKSMAAAKKEAAGSEGEAEAGARPAGTPETMTVPSGTAIKVRLLNSISSGSASSGEEFVAELSAPIETNRMLMFPKGVRVRGHVVSAKSSGRLQDSGFLRLTLDAIQTPGGRWIPAATTAVSAHGKNHNRRNLSMIGGGTGVGALIGGIAGGGKGAAIGAASGAAAGTAGAYATGKKEAVFSAESKLVFRTVDDIVFSR